MEYQYLIGYLESLENNVDEFFHQLSTNQKKSVTNISGVGGKGSRKKSRKIKNRIVKKHRKTRNKRGNVFKKRFRFNKKNRKQSRLT